MPELLPTAVTTVIMTSPLAVPAKSTVGPIPGTDNRRPSTDNPLRGEDGVLRTVDDGHAVDDHVLDPDRGLNRVLEGRPVAYRRRVEDGDVGERPAPQQPAPRQPQ